MVEQPAAVETPTVEEPRDWLTDWQTETDAICQASITRALTFIRAGRPGRGEYELVRCELRLARRAGDQPAVDVLEQFRYFEFGANDSAEPVSLDRLVSHTGSTSTPLERQRPG